MGYRVCCSRHALKRFGQTVAVQPSILWWLRLLAVFAANQVRILNTNIKSDALLMHFDF